MAIQKSSRTSRIAWSPAPVALAQGADELAVVGLGVGLQPLLELVEDDAGPWSRPVRPGPRGAPRRPRPGRSRRAGRGTRGRSRRAGGPRSPRRGRRRRWAGPQRQPGEQPGPHERRLARARRARRSARRGTTARVGLLEPPPPGADRLGQAVAVARAGDQPGEEVGVLGVEGAEPLRDDRDGRQRRGRPPRRRATGGPSASAVAVPSRASQLLRSSASSAAELVAVGHPLRQALQADPLQLAGDGALDLPGRLRVGRDDRAEDLGAIPRLGTATGPSGPGRGSRPGPRRRSGGRAGGSRRGPARAP